MITYSFAGTPSNGRRNWLLRRFQGLSELFHFRFLSVLEEFETSFAGGLEG